MTIRNWIKQQESLGKPTFSYRDVKVNFSDMPEQHIMNELYRLSRQKIIQPVYKSFYTVIPIQYSWCSPPAPSTLLCHDFTPRGNNICTEKQPYRLEL